MAKDKADHKLKVAITCDGKTTNDILCEVFLPKRLTDPIKLILSPPKNQQQLAHCFEFSIYGELKSFSGELQTLIEAQKVYFKECGTTHWGPDISETILIGDPFDLKITNFINGNSDPVIQDGVFWLTPSIMLTPLEIMSNSYTGEVKVEKSRNFEFNLPCGVKLHFAHHYRYLKGDGKDTIRFPELVAEYENTKNENSIDLILQELDDFLMITSFSARQRSVCLGWEQYERSKIISNYRRSIFVPDINTDHSFNDTLIEVNDYQEFIFTAFNEFQLSEKKDLIRQAIFRSMRDKGTIESNFLSLYSAVETLVLCNRQLFDEEAIFNPEEWKEIYKGLKSHLKKQPQLINNKTKRKEIYAKLPELNRVSFASAFESFCTKHNIDLSDLWPVVNKENGITLSEIRNKLIHGDTFTRLQEKALMSAGEHLRWSVERMILAVLNWQASKSKVCKGRLQTMTMYKEWLEDREILTENG